MSDFYQNFLRSYRRKTPLMVSDIVDLLDGQTLAHIARCETGERRPQIDLVCIYLLLFNKEFEAFFRRQIAETREDLLERIPGLIESIKKNKVNKFKTERIQFLQERYEALSKLIVDDFVADSITIFPIPNGFGFAIFGDQLELFDSGTVKLKNRNPEKLLKKIKYFIDFYEPKNLIIHCDSRSFRKAGAGVQSFRRSIMRLAKKERLSVKKISTKDVQSCLEIFGWNSKEKIAKELGSQYFKFHHREPNSPKVFETFNEHMTMYEAIALGVTDHFV